MNTRATRANNALRIFSQAGALRPENARSLSLVSKNARQVGLNMVDVIKIDCNKPDCIEKLKSKISTFARAKVIRIESVDAQDQNFRAALAILKNSKITIQGLSISLQKALGMPKLLLRKRLGERICKTIRTFGLDIRKAAGLSVSFLDAFVNLDTLELSGLKLIGTAPKLPKLSTVILSECSNYAAILSSNRSSIKRMVFTENTDKGDSNFLNVRYDNLEFLQFVAHPEALSMTDIIKQCPNLKTLITQQAHVIVSDTDLIDKVTFLACMTSLGKRGQEREDEGIRVSAGIVKKKALQYMITTFANDAELEKMMGKLNMH